MDSKQQGFFFQDLSSVQFSRPVVSNSLRPHESQHGRPPCPSPIPRVYSNSCPWSRWCHQAISSCPQSLPASGSFPMSQPFASGGQSIGVSASASVFPMNTQDWSPLGRTHWIPLQSNRLSRVFSNTTVQKASILWHSLFFMVQVYLHWNSRLGSDWWLLVIAIPIDARLTWKYSRKVFAIRIILITREKTSVPSYFISNNTCRLQILELQLILHHFQSSPCPSTCSSLSCSPSSTLMQDSVMTLQVICWKCWSP